MEFSFKVEGLEQLRKATDKIVKDTENEITKALYLSAQKVEREAKDSIRGGNKSGRIYKRGSGKIIGTAIAFTDQGIVRQGGFTSKSHRASAPGEAPASDTGRLLSSIRAYVNRISKTEAFIVAGSGIVKYARMLEYGTAKMGARPFMFPAYEKSKAWIQERLNKAVQDAINKNRK